MKLLDPKSVAIGVLSTLCIVLLIGAAGNKEKLIEAETIRVQKIQFVDPGGESHGWITTTKDGDVALTLGSIPGNRFSVWVTQREQSQGGNVVLTVKNQEGELRITGGPYGDEFGDLGPAIYMHAGRSENGHDPALLMLGIGKDPAAGFLCIKNRSLGEGGIPLGQVRGRSPLMLWGSEGLLWTAPPGMDPRAKSAARGTGR